ncbi:hypothetical protein ACFV0B_27035 [Streptomyces xanthophaeus]|uniref:hypothetical protein n=1 Tax=Streptomyces xanthophaeus TaxID=67385 RepID=UPI0036CA0E80
MTGTLQFLLSAVPDLLGSVGAALVIGSGTWVWRRISRQRPPAQDGDGASPTRGSACGD